MNSGDDIYIHLCMTESARSKTFKHSEMVLERLSLSDLLELPIADPVLSWPHLQIVCGCHRHAVCTCTCLLYISWVQSANLIAMSSGVLHQAKALPLNAAQTVEVAVKPQNIRTA